MEHKTQKRRRPKNVRTCRYYCAY